MERRGSVLQKIFPNEGLHSYNSGKPGEDPYVRSPHEELDFQSPAGSRMLRLAEFGCSARQASASVLVEYLPATIPSNLLNRANPKPCSALTVQQPPEGSLLRALVMRQYGIVTVLYTKFFGPHEDAVWGYDAYDAAASGKRFKGLWALTSVRSHSELGAWNYAAESNDP